MKQQEIGIKMNVYESDGELNPDDKDLLDKARKETEKSYAPYSNFKVGAAALLNNGKFVTGSNQENASYPAGICAERVLMSVAASLYPETGIKTIAISYHNLNGKSDHPISPCGICRQSFFEFQERTKSPVRILLSGMTGEVYELGNAVDLLPLVFSANDMQ